MEAYDKAATSACRVAGLTLEQLQAGAVQDGVTAARLAVRARAYMQHGKPCRRDFGGDCSCGYDEIVEAIDKLEATDGA